MFSINPKEYPWLENIDYNGLFHDNTETFAQEQAVWLRQNHLIGTDNDLKDIINAFEKVTIVMRKSPDKFKNIIT